VKVASSSNGISNFGSANSSSTRNTSNAVGFVYPVTFADRYGGLPVLRQSAMNGLIGKWILETLRETTCALDCGETGVGPNWPSQQGRPDYTSERKEEDSDLRPGRALPSMRPLPEPFRVSSDLKRRLSQANLRMLRCRPRPDPAPLGRQDRAFAFYSRAAPVRSHRAGVLLIFICPYPKSKTADETMTFLRLLATYCDV
jgi:hypothetical protein